MKTTKKSINHGAYFKLGEETKKIHSKGIKREYIYLFFLKERIFKQHSKTRT